MILSNIRVKYDSSANPWLDFLEPDEAHKLAIELNNDLQTYCSTSPTISTLSRLYGFGLLPLVPGIPISSLLSAVSQIKSLSHMRGVIIGTMGIGRGLDDPTLDPLWKSLSSASLTVFIHPHYGVDPSAFGTLDNGHVLPLALGFPFETTTAVARMILAGVLDRHMDLKVLLAHSGGALPMLSSRLDSCIKHDPVVAARLQRKGKHDASLF